jgi:hypothetical protein
MPAKMQNNIFVQQAEAKPVATLTLAKSPTDFEIEIV